MNSIKGLIDKSEYEFYYDFMNFNIDGYWLDEKLEELIPGNMYEGLIPTLLFALEVEKEREIVWKRILPNEGSIVNCPILMCPDDCDFYCTIIIAEIENIGKTVKWSKLGIDRTKEISTHNVGSKVEWFDSFEPLEFAIDEYKIMLDDFKMQYILDEADYKQRNESRN